MSGTLETARFVVVDVEGNGAQPPEIVELALTAMDGLAIARHPRTWLVRPSQPITPIVTRKVHGITNNEVADAPELAAITSEVLAELDDRIPVAHNARIDHEVLNRQIPAWQPTLVVDTLRLARSLWPGLKTYTLDALLTYAFIDTSNVDGNRHRAGYDSHTTALLFTVLAKTAGTLDRLLDLGCLPSHRPPTPPDEGVLF